MNKKFRIFFVFIFLFLLGFSITQISKLDFKNINYNSLLGRKNKLLIKKYLLPYRYIKEQEKKYKDDLKSLKFLKGLTPYLLELELDTIESGNDLGIKETNVIISNQKNLKKFKFTSGFYSGIHEKYPGSGYIDFHKSNLFVLSSRGVLAFNSNLENKANFKQIKNNIGEFIGGEQYRKDYRLSIKDLSIIKDKIFISFTEEIEDNCWNTSIIMADINYKFINFKKLFSAKELVNEKFRYAKCIHANGTNGEFQPHQSGGRIVSFDDNNILFSTGEYRTRVLAQNKKSVNGKIIKININDSSYKIISMGHRNPQGLYVDRENNFIIETEHGPMGGDEINVIEIEKDKVQNFGWPIASYGEHYGGRNKSNKLKYEQFPLLKSHSDNGFIEPIKAFVPSIGISEIIKIGDNKYVVGSMRGRALYFFELNNRRELKNLTKIKVGERIRDLKLKENNLYMFLEDTASIGLINIKESHF